ncbi:DUF748 domain-containing protein [Simplicispira psychrophila]|uniref:DUF748 domain-containing protein n=1 Tax=Simplicispira psychrophila TaxID=80882 RepID=UPI000485943E|nr:DUF748 domain-containing protein [Simplicispira psychrophila]
MQLPFFHYHPWARRAAGGVAGILLLWALGWLLLPPLLRSQGEKIATEKWGRLVSIGRVDFRPWTLELIVHDLAIASSDGGGPQLYIQRIYIDAALQSVLRLAPVIDAIEIDNPTVRLTQLAPSHYDIDDVLERLRTAAHEEEASSPLYFALYNLVVRGGAVDFKDETVGRTHTVRALELKVPFLSNLPSQRDIKVAPHLSFLLNDSPFDALAEAVPFTESRKAEASIHVSGVDIAPYLGYLPASVPVRLQAGLLDAHLRLAFEHTPTTAVRLSGNLQLRKVQVAQASQSPLLSFDELTVQVEDFQPLARRLHIGSVVLEAPHLSVQRSRSGQINLDLASASTATSTSPKVPPARQQSVKAKMAVPLMGTPDQGADWSLAVDRLAVRGAQVDWLDESVVPVSAQLGLRHLVLDASAMAWPLSQPLLFSGGADIVGTASAAMQKKTLMPAPARLLFSGKATEQKGQIATSMQDFSLALVAPYLGQWLTPRLTGALNADLGLAWQGAAVVAQVSRLTVDGLELACEVRTDCVPPAATGLAMHSAASLAELKKFQVDDAQVNLARRSITVGKMALTQPRGWVERDAKGRWMFERWQVARPQPMRPEPLLSAPAKRLGEPEIPWSVQWAELTLDAGSAALSDFSKAAPVSLLVSALRVRLTDFAPLAQVAKPSPLVISARIGAGRADPGRLEYDGTLGLAPLSAQGRLLAAQVPLHAFEPYVADVLQVRIRRADGSFQGQVNYAQGPVGPQLQVKGDAALDDVRVRMVQAEAQPPGDVGTPWSTPRQQAPSDDLLNWKSLQLRGVEVALAPGKPLSVDVRETVLSDFFARVILQSTGRLNLQDLLKAPPAAADVPAVVVTSSAARTSSEPSPVPPIIHIGPVLLTGGNVHFSDYFIKPNYSAQLSGLTGRLSAFSSVAVAPGGTPEMADLELRGRVEGTASLEVVGQLNPLTQPLALDIQGHMRDLELPPLSPYTVKYAGHGIERGKLSMDITYQVQPNGQLTASNKLVLNQLVFGDPVEGAPASLPVRLAVALLADRNGVIDVELPIKGSLNDPEFRLGPVIFRILGNLIMKAITSPFSLLSSALGGGDELGQVEFALGSAALDAPARQQLDKVARALLDRPALKMTVVGEASSDAERSAWKRERLQDMLLAQKRRATLRAGQSADVITAVTTDDYPVLLKELYRRTDMAKPRNVVGMAKELPQSEMEALLLVSITLPDDAMRELALARGVAVRDYLAQQPLPLERLFLGAVKTVPSVPAWTPHAELTLGTR